MKNRGQFKKGQHWRKQKPYWVREWLFREYVTEKKSAAQIAQEQGCGENNILYFLKKHGIETRTMSEIRSEKHWGASGEANGMHGRTGEDNPNWRGGCSPDRQAVYSSEDWSKAVQAVWKRDKATCQRCGTRNVKMHVHHKVPFSVKALRTTVDNLFLMCANCHRWVHSKKNTEQKFIEKAGDEGCS